MMHVLLITLLVFAGAPLGSLLCLLTNNTGPLCATTPTTIVDNTARANVGRWQTSNTNPANTAHVGTGGSLNLSPALGNVPDQTLAGNAGVNVDNTGFNLNRGGSALGVVQGGDGLGIHTDNGNVGVLGGQQLGITNITNIRNQAGWTAGQNGFAVGHNTGASGIFDVNRGIDVNPNNNGAVSVGGGSGIDILGGLLGIGQRAQTSVNRMSGDTDFTLTNGIPGARRQCTRQTGLHTGIFTQSSNVGVGISNGQFGVGKTTCILGICGQSSGGLDLGRLFGPSGK